MPAEDPRDRENWVHMTSMEQMNAYLASFTGIDGGNPRGPIWICGIEYGGEFDAPGEDLKPEIEPAAWGPAFRAKHPRYYKWPYHQKVAKLLVSLRRLRTDPAKEPDLDSWRLYMATELYDRAGDSFKLNLFPFSSPRVQTAGWDEAYRLLPGIDSKAAYYNLCRGVRFRFLEKLRGTFQPRVIVGTGKGFQEDFASAFGFAGKNFEEVMLQHDGSTRVCFLYRDGSCTLIVCPFLGGPYGLSSDGLIRELAKLIHRESA